MFDGRMATFVDGQKVYAVCQVKHAIAHFIRNWQTGRQEECLTCDPSFCPCIILPVSATLLGYQELPLNVVLLKRLDLNRTML